MLPIQIENRTGREFSVTHPVQVYWDMQFADPELR